MHTTLSAPARYAVLGTVLSALLQACQPAPDLPPYAVGITADSARLFAPDVISTALPEFATSFTADGRTVFFNRTSADRTILRLYASTFSDDDGWRAAQPLPFSDGAYNDIDPFVTPDGTRLYFSSNRPLSGRAPRDYDIWYADRTDSGWSPPVNMGGPINTGGDEIFVTRAANGNLYFSVFLPTGETGIFRSVWQEDAYRPPARLSIDLPAGARVTNPSIAPDESVLVLSSGTLPGRGSADLFLSRRQGNGTWSAPVNLGPRINSAYADFAAHISPDGRYLFFTSERPGIVPPQDEGTRPPGDLYRIILPAS